MPSNKKLIVEFPVKTQQEEKRDLDEAVKRELDFQRYLIYGILVVVAVGFLASIVAVYDTLVQSRRNESDTYSEYRQNLDLVKKSIEEENTSNIKKQIESIDKEIDLLWKNKYPIQR